MTNYQEQIFIEIKDDLTLLINNRANHLYQKLLHIDISNTDIDETGKHYFTKHHNGKRLFFSIQSSADIIYKTVKKTNKPIASLFFLDYGAGLGTLFLLAGLVGFKKVYYNDYLPQWTSNAKIICNVLEINIDDFITGDIDAVIDYGNSNTVHFDILASRNVVEHIYKLREFYSKLYQSGITDLCYNTTTANYQNLAMRLKHYRYHYQVEKTVFKKQRADYLKELIPDIKIADLNKLVKLTRGRSFADFTDAVNNYFKKQPVWPVEFLGTNTCDHKNGVWAENLISRKNYYNIIQQAGFIVEYTAGFWDTHYKYGLFNFTTACFNRIIKIIGKKGYWLSPFVNVVAYIK